MEKMKSPEPCLHCGSKNIWWSDSGYSSFNCGTVECRDCGFKLELNSLGCSPENDIRRAWNAQEKKAIERLAQLQEEVKKLKKLLRGVGARRKK